MAVEDSSESKKYYVEASAARTFVEGVLKGNGVSADDASIVAKCLVAADLRGVDTHGINRIPSYMARIRQGALEPAVTPEVNKVTPVVAQVDGRNGFGFVAARTGMALAVEMAQTFGIGMVSVKHSNHFGMAAWVVQQALDAGMMSLVFTNSSPALPVWGGKSKLMGVSPLACGAPGKDKPFILDMAPSVAARGKIYKAKQRVIRFSYQVGLRIPTSVCSIMLAAIHRYRLSRPFYLSSLRKLRRCSDSKARNVKSYLAAKYLMSTSACVTELMQAGVC